MRRVFQNILYFGDHKSGDSSEQRNVVLLNSINLLLFITMFSIFLLEVMLYFLTDNAMGYGTMRIFLVGFIGFINLILSKFGFVRLSKLSLIILPGFILAYFPVIMGHVIDEYFLYIPFGIVAMSIIPHFILSYRKEMNLFLFAMLFFLFELLFADVFMVNMADENVRITPIIRDNFMFYKVAQLAIFVFINLSIFYLKRQNAKYEVQLLSVNRDLREKSKKITEQSEELKSQNEELRENKEELQAQNEELKAYQEELNTQNESLAKALENLKKTQTKLIESEKMASIGLLMTGIAHEINNPINYINSGINGLNNILYRLFEYIDQFESIFPKCKDAVRDELDELRGEMQYEKLKKGLFTLTRDIQTGIDRTQNIIQGLSTFARTDEVEKQVCEIEEIIDSTLTILYNQYKNRIEIQKDIDNLPKYKCHPGKLSQAFLNIILNAIHAIEENGIIRITAKAPEENNHIYIEISDNGRGIPNHLQEKIFEPFFTTKEVGKGTGLGLSITSNIIEMHNGTITVSSEPGKGTTFKVALPVIEYQKTIE